MTEMILIGFLPGSTSGWSRKAEKASVGYRASRPEEGTIQDTDQEWDEIREVEGMPPPPGQATRTTTSRSTRRHGFLGARALALAKSWSRFSDQCGASCPFPR
jgi:hypothetical protein